MDPDNLPKFVYLHKNHKYRLKLGFYAAPSNPKLFSKTVRDELAKLKFTYCSDLNGLIMGFGKINSNELIQADTRHCINVAVYVDVYIFKPPVGSVIEAVVNQTSDNHVSCLVHNLFNVSIVRPEYLPCDQWSGSKIKKDDKINVKVLSFDLTKKLPHITGEIIDNENDESENSKNVLIGDSEKSSSSEECVSGFIKSFKHGCKEDDSTLKYSSSDSESPNEMDMVTTRSRKLDAKSIKTSPLLNNSSINNSKPIENLFSTSTPIFNSDHSIVNLNLVKNKQIEQLQKHLAKNSTEKRKSSASDKFLNQVPKTNIFQSSNNSNGNNIKTIDRNCNELNVLASSVNSNDNLDSTNKTNEQNNVILSDSGISGDEHGQNKCHNLFSNTFQKSPKKHKALKATDKIVGAILHSLSPNKNKSKVNTIKQLSVDINNDPSSNDNEMNNIYTQHNIGVSNLNKDLLNNFKSSAKSTLRLSTKSIEKSNSFSNINLEDSKNQLKSESVKNHSNDIFSMIFDSESSSSSEEMKLTVKNIINRTKFVDSDLKTKKCSPAKERLEFSYASKPVNIYTKPDQNISKIEDTKHLTNKSLYVDSSDNDDEIYTKLKQNISKIEDTKHLTNKNLYVDSSDNDDEIYSKLKQNSSKIEDTKHLTNKSLDVDSSDNDDEIYTTLKQNSSKIEDTKHLTNKSLDVDSSDNDDEMYTKLKQNTSKIEDTKHLINKSLDVDSSDNDDEIYTKLKQNISKIEDSKYANDKTHNKGLLDLHSSDNDEIYAQLRKNKSKIEDIKSLTEKTQKQKLHDIYSSDGDEIFTNLKQNISKIEETKPSAEKTQNQKYDTYSSDNESDSSNKLNQNTFHDYLKLIKSNETNFINMSVNDNYGKKSAFLHSSKSGNNKSRVSSNLISGENNKSEIIKQILANDSTSEDEMESTSNKNNIDEYNLMNKIDSNTFQTSKVQSRKKSKTTLNKEISNPFIKLYTGHSNSSSSEDDSFIISSTKSKLVNNSSKKKNAESVNEEDKKNILIQQVLSSLKHKGKAQKLSVESNNQDISKDISKSINVKEPNKEKLKLKNKKKVMKKLRNPMKELKPCMSTVNLSHIDVPLQLKTQSCSDDSTDDEMDLINKILDKQKLNVTELTNISEANNQKKLKKLDEILDIKFDKKSSKITKGKIINDWAKTIKDKPKETKNFLDNPTQTKIKKKNCSLPFETNESLIDNLMNSIANSSDVHSKVKKKKKSSNVIDETNNLSKNKESNILENSLGNSTQIKKRKNNHNTIIDTNESLIDNVINSIENSSGIHSKVKKKKKSTNLINETNDSSKSKENNSLGSSLDDFTQTKKRKRDHNIIIDTNESLINNFMDSIENSSGIHSKIKKKKKSTNLINETNDLSKNEESNVLESPLSNSTQTIKKKKDHNINIGTNESLINNFMDSIENSSGIHSKIKKKKKSTNLINETNDLSKNEESNVLESPLSNSTQTKKKKKDHNINIGTNEFLINSFMDSIENSPSIPSKMKKKKKTLNLINEINDSSKNEESNVLESPLSNSTKTKKKKKDHNINIGTNEFLINSFMDSIENSPSIPSKMKKKKKTHNLINVTNVEKDFLSSHTLTKKKKDHNSIIETNNSSIGVETFPDTHTKIKKKKNKSKSNF